MTNTYIKEVYLKFKNIGVYFIVKENYIFIYYNYQNMDLNELFSVTQTVEEKEELDEGVQRDLEFIEKCKETIFRGNANFQPTEKDIKMFLSKDLTFGKYKDKGYKIKDLIDNEGKDGIWYLEFLGSKADQWSHFFIWHHSKEVILHFHKNNEVIKKDRVEFPFVNFKELHEYKKGKVEVLQGINEWKKLRDEKTIVYLDTETTGLNRDNMDSAIQVYMTKTFQGKRIDDKILYIKPYKKHSPKEVEKVHWITKKYIAENGLSPIEGLKQINTFLEWCDKDNTIIIAHNAWFDKGILDTMYNDWRMKPIELPFYDSIQILSVTLKYFNKDIKKMNLSYLIEKYLWEDNIQNLIEEITVALNMEFNDREMKNTKMKSLEKEIRKFIEVEKRDDFLFDANTQELENDLDNGNINWDRILKILKEKESRRHKWDYDTIKLMQVMEKLYRDWDDWIQNGGLLIEEVKEKKSRKKKEV